jgi:hypothetical protein
MAIKLGSKVKDSITDYAGIAVARTEFLYGCVKVCVESKKLKDGAIQEEWIDEFRLEKHPTIIVSPTPPLGTEVNDSITGFSGIATSRTEQLNNCIRIGVTSKKERNDKGAPLELWFDEQRLGLKTAKVEKPPGGPGPTATHRRIPTS